MSYDDNNIFAKILRGEIPNKTVLETDDVLAFDDIDPRAPVHTLVIPKGSYVNMQDMAAKASDAEIAALFKAIVAVAEKQGVSENGFRIISNNGENGGQEVPHLHFHVLGGAPVGRMISKSVKSD